jgi:hypothetical protein
VVTEGSASGAGLGVGVTGKAFGVVWLVDVAARLLRVGDGPWHGVSGFIGATDDFPVAGVGVVHGGRVALDVTLSWLTVAGGGDATCGTWAGVVESRLDPPGVETFLREVSAGGGVGLAVDDVRV